MSALTYLFYPNPGNAYYSSPKALTLLVVCALLAVGSFAFRWWRRRQDQKFRQLTRSWSSAMFWFGVTGLVLVVARVEQIQYVAMRFWWLVWLVAFAAYAFLQFKLFRARYYQVLPTVAAGDPREKYLPKRKK